MIEDPFLMSNPELRHGFFTRRGGWSSGIYRSLNCGFGSNDERKSVERNRAHVTTALGMEPAALAVPHQVHSPRAVVLTSVPEAPPRADALVTASRDIVVGVLTADCAPVLMADPDVPVVAAAHAGWRGALDGVLDATLTAMEEAGARRQRIAAAIGPTIQQEAYEVGAEFRDRFVDADAKNGRFFASGRQPDRFQFDLPAYCAARLRQLGLLTVSVSASCTYRDEADFFSYRRSVHRREPDYGRQIAAITLGPSGFQLGTKSGPS